MTITLNDRGFIAKLSALAKEIQTPSRLMKILGRQLNADLKAHFRAKNKTPNQLGGKRTNFWRQISQSVQNPVLKGADGTRVSVTISDPRFAQKLYGGTITAKRGKALTIPRSPEAHGRRASVLEAEEGIELFLLYRDGRATNFLAAIEDSGELKIHYLLVRSVDQDADPTALPPEAELAASAIKRGEEWIARMKRENRLN